MLSRNELKEIDRILAKAQSVDLREWERDFIDDITERVEHYRENSYISASQLEQLHRIDEEYEI